MTDPIAIIDNVASHRDRTSRAGFGPVGAPPISDVPDRAFI
jgi:hypothetical protein